MAQVMPPLSPRARRSGRRSGPTFSTSHSPESDITPRPPLLSSISSSNNSRNKRLKQEDLDDLTEDRRINSTSSSNSSTQSSSRSKRKPKEKPEETIGPEPAQPSTEMPVAETQAVEDEEEQGITRCICGSTGEDDPDAGEFMVQCEECNVWQHGLCMGFESEDLLHEGSYYCELCRPDMHVELLKKLARRPRQSSANSHHTNSRLSRSRSPHQVTTSKQQSKRRNTMNSRDAEFDENLKQILETTAIEAGADPITFQVNDQLPFEELEHTNNRNKKRKRSENNDPPPAKKRTRSMSTTSEHPVAAKENEEAPVILPPPPPPASKSGGGRNKRGGRKSAAVFDIPIDNGDGVLLPPAPRRSGNSHRKGGKASARPPQSNAAGQSSNSDSRRAQGPNSSGATQNATDSRAYRNSHAYVVSQQPLYTSWNLPDYLSHLEEMLPTEVPKPLEVVAGATGRESVERTTERGVKVKWPSKRTSVTDMNKRVRALVEWVGREQASASDRARRREALENALRESGAVPGHGLLDPPIVGDADRRSGDFMALSATTSMKDMEALMEELIGFQEKFGPGARRDRRAAAS